MAFFSYQEETGLEIRGGVSKPLKDLVTVTQNVLPNKLMDVYGAD